MKTAISLPDPLYEAAERAALQLGLSRSRLYAEALREFLQRRSDLWIREALDAVYRTEPSELEAGLEAAQAEILEDEGW